MNISDGVQALDNETLLCRSYNPRRERGVFFGHNPMHSVYGLLLLQLSIPSFLSTCVQMILSPLGQSSFFAQMVVGITLGPSSFGKGQSIAEKLYPIQGAYVNKTFAFFGLIMYMFLVGVKMDLSILKRSGKKAVAIGCGTFVVPISVNAIVAIFLKKNVELGPHLENALLFISSVQSISSYHVIASVLADLNILNSELGRLASSSSMISGGCSWIWAIISLSGMEAEKRRSQNEFWELLTAAGLVILVIYICRPISVYMIRQIPEGKALSEAYVIWVFMMILLVTLFSETIGRRFMFGPMLLGLAVPDGPPLGSALVTKLETCVSCIFLPTYFVFSGSMVNLSSIRWKTVEIVGFLYVCSFAGKIVGVMLPSLYNRMPLVDAFTMGLIMSVQGITDVMVLHHAMLLELIDEDTYSVMSVSMIMLTGIVTPIVKMLYKPSKRYKHCKNRTIQHAQSEAELRILACIHHPDNTPSIINLFEVSNPTLKTPICFYVVHLIELAGRSTPLLRHHKLGKSNSLHANLSSHIIKAFRLYEKESHGGVLVNVYTDIAPFASMHYEICQLAIDKRCSLVIIPFHVIWTMHGMDELPNPVRTVNRQFLQIAPCSVGIFIDRGTLIGTNTRKEGSKYKIGMIFLEGADDREALSYAMRMGEHPDVSLTVVRLMDTSYNAKNNKSNFSKKLDDSVIKEFKIAIVGQKSFNYIEEVVHDIFETVRLIRSVENSFDLILVGKRHSNESSLKAGITEWNEFPELGYVGDMLASSDSSCVVSVLVVQQQIKGDH